MSRSSGRRLVVDARQVLQRVRERDRSVTPSFGGIVDGFAEVQRQYSDLNFYDPGGTLEVRRRLRSVVSIRIELPQVEYLHLASVLIDADGVKNIARRARVRASSSWQIYQDALDSGLMFDPDNRDVAVHTKRDNRPWVEIDFTRPLDLNRIMLRNRNDARSVRARGILVRARHSDGSWTTLYDGALREREFALAVERQYARQLRTHRAAAFLAARPGRDTTAAPTGSSSADGGTPEVDGTAPEHSVSPAAVVPDGDTGADLTRLLTDIRLQDLSHVHGDLKNLGLSRQDEVGLKSLINSTLLAPRELEWSTHGVRKTFRFWSREEKQHYIDFSRAVIDCLSTLNEHVCFGFGSVLSVVRDHDLIPHDDDLDVIIGFEPSQAKTLDAALKLVRKHLTDHDFVAYGTSPANLNVRDRENFKKLDVFVGIFEGDDIAWYPGRRGSLTRAMVFPPREIELLDRPCPVPRETERYLHELYGEGWRTPDPNFHHPFGKRKAEYNDIQR